MNQGLLILSAATVALLPFTACGGAHWSAVPFDASVALPDSGTTAAADTGDAGSDSAMPLADAGYFEDASEAEAAPPLPQSGSILQHHNSATRTGSYVEPLLTHAAVGTMHLDPSFSATFDALVRTQPLYVVDGVNGAATFYVTTESNDVYAFDATAGAVLWHRNFGPASNVSTIPCGSHPTSYGINSTPIIDPTSRTIYVVVTLGTNAEGSDSGPLVIQTEQIHALSIDDGTERPGWPIDPTGIQSNGHTFDPRAENQRGALAIDNGYLYLPYGSYGDCGAYQGWIISVPLSDPDDFTGYAVPGTASGIWAPGGVAVENGSLFVATGNSGDPPDAWAGGEAVLRFPTGVPIPQSPADLFAPANWHTLDTGDWDLGVTGVTLIDMPASTPSALALAVGKDGYAYLLDQNHLGGLSDGGPVGIAKVQVSTNNPGGAVAVFTTSRGTVAVFDTQDSGVGLNCPAPDAGDLVALLLTNGTPPTLTTLWCAANSGHGVPIVTTTDGTTDPIVWITADTGSELHAFDGLTGATLFSGGSASDRVAGMNRFNTVIPADNRIFIGATNGLYAFTP